MTRIDPYYHGLWAGGVQASWMTRRVADEAAAAGFGRLAGGEREVSPGAPVEAVLTPRLRRRRLSGLAAVNLWRTLTLEQVASITGQSSDCYRWNDMTTLWSAGLVDRGRFVTSLRGSQYPPVYRALPGRDVERFLARLPFDEWLAVTGSYPVIGGSRHDRHNLLAAELALRFAEFTDVAGVFGETLSTHALLARNPPRGLKVTRSAGDATLVRGDGLRLVIELTANPGNVDRKVKRWCELMASSTFDEDGMVVVFVDASSSMGSQIDWNKMRHAVERTVGDVPGAVRNRLDERFAVARWSDWFPGPYLVGDGFRTMSVERPTGAAPDRWEPVDLLGPGGVGFAPAVPEEFLAVLANQNLLLGCPHWLLDEGSDMADRLSGFLQRRAEREPAAPPGVGLTQAA